LKKYFIKNLMLCILSLCIIVSNFSSVRAQSTSQGQIPRDIDVLDEQAWNLIEQDIKRLEAQGYKLVPKNRSFQGVHMSGPVVSNSSPDDWTEDEIDGTCDSAYWTTIDGRKVRVCIIENLLTKSEVITDKSDINKIFNTGYNIIIGIATKYLWIPSTLRQAFLDEGYEKGDSLVMTKSVVVKRKFYKAWKDEPEIWDTCVATEKRSYLTEAKYSKNVNGRPELQDEEEHRHTEYTENYFNTNWLDEQIDIRTTWGQSMAFIYDCYE